MDEHPDRNDWRRTGQERFLLGVRLVHERYRERSPLWEHDHCEFCFAKFSEAPGDLDRGVRTEDGSRWICLACFHDFRAEFRWTVAPDDSSVDAPKDRSDGSSSM